MRKRIAWAVLHLVVAIAGAAWIVWGFVELFEGDLFASLLDLAVGAWLVVTNGPELGQEIRAITAMRQDGRS